MNKIDKNTCPHGSYLLVGQMDDRQIQNIQFLLMMSCWKKIGGEGEVWMDVLVGDGQKKPH